MGNKSSRVKKRVPRNLKRRRSFRKKAKKHEECRQKSEQADARNNEHFIGDEPSTIGKSTMFLGYDSDAEVLDLKEVLDDDTTQIATATKPLKGGENYNQGKSGGEMKTPNGRPYLM